MLMKGTDSTALAARLKAEVDSEILRLSKVVGEIEQALVHFDEVDPTPLELRGLANLLHDFYTGIEKVFKRIAPELNGGLPEGDAWHRRLLENMAMDISGVRPAVLRQATAASLDEFLRFRHLVRNIYGFELVSDRLLDLARRVVPTWQDVHADLTAFAAFLEKMAGKA